MGDKVRVDIEIRICDEQGPQPHSFVAAQRIAYDRMNEACVMYVSIQCTQIVSMFVLLRQQCCRQVSMM